MIGICEFKPTDIQWNYVGRRSMHQWKAFHFIGASGNNGSGLRWRYDAVNFQVTQQDGDFKQSIVAGTGERQLQEQMAVCGIGRGRICHGNKQKSGPCGQSSTSTS
jgi:hypothetical protein